MAGEFEGYVDVDSGMDATDYASWPKQTQHRDSLQVVQVEANKTYRVTSPAVLGYEGKGAMAEVSTIVDVVKEHLQRQSVPS
ncbi:hypothetical protein JZ751_019667 [Albula glossodonta]|uniref:Uncharacterized protein n=1 Tax=Albula glossodonta TaxID=121402 RepID=A0A8T2NNN3_9TELE|nr:hypothetical protein JZ751_019667 [Albula glossodonta]